MVFMKNSFKEKKGASSNFYFLIKRLFDFCSSFLLLLVLLPLFLLLSLLVLVTNPGPIFFKDHRVGKNGKPIKVLKFRSMYVDAETNPGKYLSDEQLLQWKTERKIDHDPRITPIGKIIRKTSLDELPQLINIIFGSMSVIGPRPITPSELAKNYSSEQQKILLSVRPGLLGYWQVFARNDAVYETGERQQMELYYFSHLGFALDMSILFRALPSMLKHKAK
jgi:lipopolysaccharide/colanic/teichoic acid biosynthesis glycosyltransferase